MMSISADTPSDCLPEILFEDNHVLVAVKKPGVLSQADGGSSPDMLSLLKEDIRRRYKKTGQVYLGLVHRLDQPVGGIMVFARTSKAAGRLSAQIRERRMDKYYLAVVEGLPEPDQAVIEDQLLKNEATGMVQVVPPGSGTRAWLAYRILEKNPAAGRALLVLKLGSGRGHQIRVQLASRGWPIVGDRRYGSVGKQAGGSQSIATDKPKRNLPADPALFACSLAFDHPISGQRLCFSAWPPAAVPWIQFAKPELELLPSLFQQSGDEPFIHK